MNLRIHVVLHLRFNEEKYYENLSKVYTLNSHFSNFFGCSISQKESDEINSNENTTELWSVKMANSVIAKSDSLIWYKDLPKPKWTYDLAFLGQAIDKLGCIDTTYSKYSQDYFDYFVQENGTVKTYTFENYNLDL